MKLSLVLTICCLTLYCFAVIAAVEETDDGVKTVGESKQESFSSIWPVGDARRCQDAIKDSHLGVKRFEVMPGLGWDNLRNMEAAEVVTYNYSRCRMTDDGNFLIPDNVFTIPLKTSNIQTFAELISDYTKSASTTSNTINANAGLTTIKFGISGSFSYENQRLKENQIEDDSVTVRVQVRYNRYEAKLQPDSGLSPHFKRRVGRIAMHVLMNQTEMAYYMAQLLVKDFGTHVLTSVTAGAALIKDDYVRRKFVDDNMDEKTKILASAAGSYNNIFKADASYARSTDQTMDDMYSGNTTNSFIMSQGGNMVIAGETNFSEWAAGVDNNMVTMDRAGDPLYFYINPQAFPQLPATVLYTVQEMVQKSVELYYAMNAIPGCTRQGDDNFNEAANFNDGSCGKKHVNTSSTFGGVYQTCTVSGQYLRNNPCQGLDQVNPKTGKHSCPENFTEVHVHSGRYQGASESETHCKKCHLFRHCCHTNQYISVATYNAYWCAATDKAPKSSGYLFGGLFTSTQSNARTGARTCPNNFYPRRLFSDMSVCISDDFEMDSSFSLPFGGFFSCNMGNPLAVSADDSESELENFLQAADGLSQASWPKRCPIGYSAHLAADDNGCSIHFCLGTGSLKSPVLPAIKLPPFNMKPAAMALDVNYSVVVDPISGKLMPSEETEEFLATYEDESVTEMPIGQKESEDEAMTPVIAGTIGAVIALVCVGVVVLAIYGSRRLRASSRKDKTTAREEAHINHGQTDDNGAAVENISERM